MIRRLRPAWLLGLVLAMVLGAGAGTAFALWRAQASSGDLLAQQAVLGLAVTKDQTTDVAASSADTVQFTIGQTEAQALVDAGPDQDGTFGVAVPFAVTTLASAGYGMDYSIDLEAPQSGTVFGLAGGNTVIFPVEDPGQCTVANAALAQPYTVTDPVTGVGTGANAAQTQADDWCLVFTVIPPADGGTATADGTTLLDDPHTSATDDASVWWAYVIPDPTAEPDLAVTVTPIPQSAAGLAA